MKERVQLFPDVIVSPAIADTIKYFGVGPTNTTEPEEYKPLEEITSSEVFRLKKKIIRSLRRHETFAPSDHQWRRDINSAEKGHLGKKIKREDGYRVDKPIPPLSYEVIQLHLAEPPRSKPFSTNEVLEYLLGIPEGQRRNNFLRRFDGNCLCGADIIRAAFQVADFYGLTANYSETPQKKEILKAVIDSIYRGCRQITDLNRSVQLTDLLIESFGLEKMPELMRKYHPFRKINSLVPKGDVYTIATAMQLPEFRSLKGPALMCELDYQFIEVDRIPVLYYKPPTKPI